MSTPVGSWELILSSKPSFEPISRPAVAIGRQLRLRNLGGMVVIDFIDMDDDEHRRQVLRTLERSLDEGPGENPSHRV